MSRPRRCAAAGFVVSRALVVGMLALSAEFAWAQTQETDTPPVAVADVTLPGDDIAPATQAVWMEQNFDFHYQSFTTFYSCSSLAEKMRRILIELGAERKTKVRVSGCDSSSGIARMPVVRISTASPFEATPETLADLEKTRPVRELAARVRNDRAKGIEMDEQFPAHWKRVSLSRGSLGLSPGDCELVEQIERKLLPKLAVRIVSSDMRCTPNQLTLGQPRLEVEALAELPKADDVTDKKKRKSGV